MADFADLGAQAADRHLSESMRARQSGRGATESYTHCEDCGEPIPEARRLAMPGCIRCIECQEIHEVTGCGH